MDTCCCLPRCAICDHIKKCCQSVDGISAQRVQKHKCVCCTLRLLCPALASTRLLLLLMLMQVTYPMHIILRYEIERGLISGAIQVCIAYFFSKAQTLTVMQIHVC